MLRVKNKDVAIAPIFDPQRTSGGLWIPDIAKERCDQGIVKYMGSQVSEVHDGLYYGSHVMFSAYDGTLSRIDGEGILIFLPADKIVAVLHPPETRIDGVYFKSPLEKEELKELKEELRTILRTLTHDLSIQSIFEEELVEEAITKIIQAGFLKNQYFPCNYEMTIQLVADAITNADWKDQYRFKDRSLTSPSTSNVFK